MLNFSSYIPRSSLLVAAALALWGVQASASLAQQPVTSNETGGKPVQPVSAPASPGRSRSSEPSHTASKPTSPVADDASSSNGMRLIRYGRQSRIYGVH